MKSGLNLLVFLFLIFGIVIQGCRDDHKSFASGQKQISREQMIRLMADFELTESALKMKQVKLSRDSVRLIAARCYDSLYAFYGISPEQFRENLRFYQSDMEDFQAMMDSVIVALTRHKDSVSAQNKAAQGDSILKIIKEQATRSVIKSKIIPMRKKVRK
ncbi:MAG: DUF4296 domain-containing protein [Bacteroidota bacterium]